MSTAYDEFIAGKSTRTHSVGHEPTVICEALFPFQRAIVDWAIRKGRAAIFADTGLGKTLMQCAWADER